MCVNNLPRVASESAVARIRTRELTHIARYRDRPNDFLDFIVPVF